MALTLMFEQSLQAVNPAVAVPYWDFTLESTFFGSSDFRSSGVFADDWFGAASPDNVRQRDRERGMKRERQRKRGVQQEERDFHAKGQRRQKKKNPHTPPQGKKRPRKNVFICTCFEHKGAGGNF